MTLVPSVAPGLAEAAVWLAMDHKSGATYFEERDALYAIDDPDERDRAFRRLHNSWLERLGHAQPLVDALAAQPLIGASVATCIVRKAQRGRDEGAELFVRPGAAERDARRLTLAILPATFIDAVALESLLERELMHIADMLDPTFGYQPTLPVDGRPGKLTQERYTALWTASVAARLCRASRTRIRDQLLRTLPELAGTRALRRLLAGRRPTHAELVSLAADASARAHRCPMCDMPSHQFESVEDERLAQHIRRQRTDWDGAPVCPQCAELYRSRLDRREVPGGDGASFPSSTN